MWPSFRLQVARARQAPPRASSPYFFVLLLLVLALLPAAQAAFSNGGICTEFPCKVDNGQTCEKFTANHNFNNCRKVEICRENIGTELSAKISRGAVEVTCLRDTCNFTAACAEIGSATGAVMAGAVFASAFIATLL